MGLEKVTLKFTNEELKNLLNERLNRKGIEIEAVTLDGAVKVDGKLSFLKALPSLKFSSEVVISQVKEGNLYAEIKSFSFLSKDFSNLVQKSIDKIIDLLDKDGISREENSIVIEMAKVLSQLDVNNTEIYDVYVAEGSLNIDANNLDELKAVVG